MYKLILALLVFSLVPLAEIFLFIYLSGLIGNYLILAIVVVVGLVGGLIAISQVKDSLDRIRKRAQSFEYPVRECAELCCGLLGSVLLLTPGFITDVLGFLLLVPGIRQKVIRLAVKRMSKGFKGMSEFLKLDRI